MRVILENDILKVIKKYNLISSGDIIVVGVSGGPDSMCLLNVLNNLKEKLNIQIVVAHINHQIRKEAEEETQYVKDFCDKKGIKCFIKYIAIQQVAEAEKIGEEEAGRKERYNFFEEVLKQEGANKIATAHNENDKVETILMNIIRGSGVAGLKGIDAMRNNKIIRPLIETKRVNIEKYCEENNLNPKFDASNKENKYTRNKVRNLLIPYLQKEFNSNIVEAVNKLSELASMDNDYIEKQVKKSFDEIVVEKGKYISLNLKKFNALDDVIKNRLLLYTISEVVGTAKDIEKKHIEDIIKLCENNVGNKYLTPKKHIKITVKNKKILFEHLNL